MAKHTGKATKSPSSKCTGSQGFSNVGAFSELGFNVAGSGGSPSTTVFDTSHKGTGVVLSNGNLTAVLPAGQHLVLANVGKSAGKWYWEVHWDSTAGEIEVGVATQNVTLDSNIGNTANGWGYDSSASKAHSASFPGYGLTYTVGDTIGVALDMDTGTLTFYKNGSSQGVAYSTGLTGLTLYPAASNNNAGAATVTANFGASAFVGTVPNGYTAGIY